MNRKSLDNLSEKALIIACQNNDKEAWEEFYKRYNRLLLAVIRRILLKFGPEYMDTVNDILHCAYVALMGNACKRLRSFEGKSKLSTYLNVVVHNICIDYLRKNKVGIVEVLHYEDMSSFDDEEEKVSRLFYYVDKLSFDPHTVEKIQLEEERTLLHDAINNLPSRVRIILRLVCKGKKMSEIAVLLRLPLGTVESRVYRSVEKIKKMVVDEMKEAA